MQLTKFLLVGVFATSLNFLIFLLLLQASLGLSISSAAGFMLGTAVSYKLNSTITFKDSSSHGFARYLMVNLFALGVQLALVNVLFYLGSSESLANGIAIATIAVLKFFALRKWAFPSNKQP